MKEEIVNLLYNALDMPYCDTCRFNYESDEISKADFDYYACDECNRRSMGWKISKDFCEDIADEVLKKTKKILDRRVL